jgi:hypothetical protein
MRIFRILLTGYVFLVPGSPAHAYDVNERFSISGILGAGMQCQNLSGKAGADNECRGALPLQPEASFRPTGRDEIFIKFGFAGGNGLNDESPFALSPWVADLHDDVKNINGSGRDYLLTAWYQHTSTLRQDSGVEATIGIIDATDYLDENVYTNDEYTQFMNQALVNGPKGFLPSYDTGGALVWNTGFWSLRGVVMNVDENDDDSDYTFYGAQLGYKMLSKLGEGNYRILLDRTSKDFLDAGSESRHKRAALLFSFDQEFGDVVGAFLRFGWQKDDAAVNYDTIWSGGIDISGAGWKRPDDNIGLGFAYLEGGNLAIVHSQVVEAYYRLAFNEGLALSADIQYMKDDLRHQENPAGFICGLRLTAAF